MAIPGWVGGTIAEHVEDRLPEVHLELARLVQPQLEATINLLADTDPAPPEPDEVIRLACLAAHGRMMPCLNGCSHQPSRGGHGGIYRPHRAAAVSSARGPARRRHHAEVVGD